MKYNKVTGKLAMKMSIVNLTSGGMSGRGSKR